jgi:hypothetical protein
MYTIDTRSTMIHMLKQFVPDDREDSDKELHRKIRKEIQEPQNADDDKDFTKEEIIDNFEKISSKKAPGENGLKSDILIRASHVFPLFFTQIYNTCLKEGCFPKNGNIKLEFPLLNKEKKNLRTYRNFDQ